MDICHCPTSSALAAVGIIGRLQATKSSLATLVLVVVVATSTRIKTEKRNDIQHFSRTLIDQSQAYPTPEATRIDYRLELRAVKDQANSLCSLRSANGLSATLRAHSVCGFARRVRRRNFTTKLLLAEQAYIEAVGIEYIKKLVAVRCRVESIIVTVCAPPDGKFRYRLGAR
eukprot:scaffold32159_cov35-Prasinocladus_malaysianus.AAC.2